MGMFSGQAFVEGKRVASADILCAGRN